MHHLVAIIGNYGPHWRSLLPAVAHHRDECVMFFDHRQSPRGRARAINDTVQVRQITSFDVTVVDAPAGSCDEGYHVWEAIRRGVEMVGATCRRCGYAEMIDPLPFPCVQRLYTAAS